MVRTFTTRTTPHIMPRTQRTHHRTTSQPSHPARARLAPTTPGGTPPTRPAVGSNLLPSTKCDAAGESGESSSGGVRPESLATWMMGEPRVTTNPLTWEELQRVYSGIVAEEKRTRNSRPGEPYILTGGKKSDA